MLITVEISEHGRIAISKPVRDALAIGVGDLVEIQINEFTTTVPVRSAGRATIPSCIRDEVGLEQGDVLEVVIRNPGHSK